ncbi:hypothetical protein B0H14DRAFT_2571315 [Mycena olivaceomarginata]|nr:hypothetical protein B0H14DRAFT_2571315 [Mycena olivaceomarginata]
MAYQLEVPPPQLPVALIESAPVFHRHRKNKDFTAVNLRDELKAYLDSALQNVDDVVAWWSVRKPQVIPRCVLVVPARFSFLLSLASQFLRTGSQKRRGDQYRARYFPRTSLDKALTTFVSAPVCAAAPQLDSSRF